MRIVFFWGGARPGNVAPNFLELAAAALCTSTWQHVLYSPVRLWRHSLVAVQCSGFRQKKKPMQTKDVLGEGLLSAELSCSCYVCWLHSLVIVAITSQIFPIRSDVQKYPYIIIHLYFPMPFHFQRVDEHIVVGPPAMSSKLCQAGPNIWAQHGYHQTSKLG